MLDLNALYFFSFVFSILIILRNTTKFISSLLPKEPKPIYYGNMELIYLGLSISYFFTYIFYL